MAVELKESEFVRLNYLPPYPLGEIAEVVQKARLTGREVIDLSQVNPNLGPPPLALDRLVQACLQPHNHRYSASQGINSLREAAALFYQDRFGVQLAPDSQVAVTMGCKEGLAHLLLAIASNGDNVIVPTPSYPIHTASVAIAGAGFVGLPLFLPFSSGLDQGFCLTGRSDSFFERLELIYAQTWPPPKLMVLSFPHNPTTATVDLSFFERLVEFARVRKVYLIHDFAYATLCYDGYNAPSILSIPGASDIAVEFFSLSKCFNMPGWRIAFCLGNQRLISGLKRIKSYLDYGIFQPLQIAAAKMLRQAILEDVDYAKELSNHYQNRRDVLCEGLKSCGWELNIPKATVFVWARMPQVIRKEGSFSWCRRLLENADLALCPGAGFGEMADDYVRFALVENEKSLRQAVQRIKDFC